MAQSNGGLCIGLAWSGVTSLLLMLSHSGLFLLELPKANIAQLWNAEVDFIPYFLILKNHLLILINHLLILINNLIILINTTSIY